MKSFALLPWEPLARLDRDIQSRLESAACALRDCAGLEQMIDPTSIQLLRDLFATIGATEGTIWLLDADENYLIPHYNSGPCAEKMKAEVRQPADSGLIGMVLATGSSFHSAQTYMDPKHDKSVDTTLCLITCSMVAVPFNFAGQPRGVISAVTLKQGKAAADPAPIPASAIGVLGRAAEILGRLIEYRLLLMLMGRV